MYIYIYTSVPYVCTRGGQKRALDALGQELEVEMSHHVGAENWSLEEQPVFFPSEPLPSIPGLSTLCSVLFLCQTSCYGGSKLQCGMHNFYLGKSLFPNDATPIPVDPNSYPSKPLFYLLLCAGNKGGNCFT